MKKKQILIIGFLVALSAVVVIGATMILFKNNQSFEKTNSLTENKMYLIYTGYYEDEDLFRVNVVEATHN